MKINRNISTCQLLHCEAKLSRYLDNNLAFYCPGYQFTPSFQEKRWDGKRHFFNKFNGRFPSGLLQKVTKLIKDFTNQSVEVIDNRTPPGVVIPLLNKLIPNDKFKELRPYQLQAVDNILKAETCIIKAATNAGKTEIYAELIRRLNFATVILIHRKELLYQTAQRLKERLGIEIGLIGDGNFNIKQITVAMITSMVSYEPKPFSKQKRKVLKPKCNILLNYLVLIFDECHNHSNSMMEYFVNLSKAYYRIALSGTPLLNDIVTNYSLIGAFGEIAFEITNTELINAGISSKPFYYFYEVKDSNIKMLDYRDAYEQGIVNCTIRNDIIQQAVKQVKGLNTLIIVKEIAHGDLLNKLILKSVFIHGSKTSKHRQERIQNFKKGKIKTLIVSTILDEGVDIANINLLIIAAGMKSSKRLLQRIGRGLRMKKSKKVTIIDFLDTGNEYLLQHSVERVKTIKNENFEVKLLKDIRELAS